MKIWHNMTQGTDDWRRARAGRPTASKFSNIITATGKDSTSWEPYALELIGDSIRPDMMGWEGNKNTDRGNELEPEAREVFTQETGITVEQVGFITREDNVIGCSPDGLVYEDGIIVAGLEIKCPTAKAHISYFMEGILPATYRQQVHGSIAVTGLNTWHFISYCQGIRPFITIVERDEYTEKVSDALDRFLIYYAAKRNEIIPILTRKARP